MTNRLALLLAFTIVSLIALDHWMGWGGTLFLMRKFVVLVDWMIFWR